MSLLKLKPNKMLNGKVYPYGQFCNNIQKDHYKGVVDVYAPIVRNNIEYPSIAAQWKNDANRRFRKW